MILFQTQIEEHQQLAEHYRELAAKREAIAAELIAVQEQADANLLALKDLLEKCQEASPNAICASQQRFAIASLKSAVLGLFPDDGNDSGGNQPDSPTPPDSPDSDEPELMSLNGLTGDFLLSSDEPEKNVTDDLPQAEALEPEALHPGSRFWFGGQSNTGTVIKALDSGEYLCQIDGAVGEVALLRSQLYYIDEPLVGQTSDWFEAPKVGQACELSCELPAASIPFIELVTHPENEHVAYQRKGDGEIVCTYVGFRTKAIAQSWREFVEALAFHVELRQAKRMQGFKWELKCKGISMQQIDRLAKNCDLAKSHRTEVCSSLPPSYKKPIHPTPVALDEVKPGDIVTPLLAPGDSYEVLQVMPNGILDCKSLRTGVQMGLKPTSVTLVQKAVIQEPEAQRHQLQSGDRVVVRQVHSRSTFHKIPADELVRVSLLPVAATGDDAFDF